MSTTTNTNKNDEYIEQLFKKSKELYNDFYNDFGQRFTKANEAAVALQRQQQQQSEDAFYRNLYDTNQTVLDTIRKNNASAIASGASKGTQAANELAAMLGMQQESVDSATQLAQQGYDLAAQQQQNALQASVDAAQAASGLTSNLASALSTSQQADAVRYQTEFEANYVQDLIKRAGEGDLAAKLELSIKVPEYAQGWIEDYILQNTIDNPTGNTGEGTNKTTITPGYHTEREYSATTTYVDYNEDGNHLLHARLPKYDSEGNLTDKRFASSSDKYLGTTPQILTDADVSTIVDNENTENVTMILSNSTNTQYMYAVYKNGAVYVFASDDPTDKDDNIARAILGMLKNKTNVFTVKDDSIFEDNKNTVVNKSDLYKYKK